MSFPQFQDNALQELKRSLLKKKNGRFLQPIGGPRCIMSRNRKRLIDQQRKDRYEDTKRNITHKI